MTTVTAFSRILVANRGEIAVRVLATLRRLGITGIGVTTTADREAAHVRAADVTVLLDDGPSSYLSVGAIIDAARRSGAEAIHPGYGFLSESASFAQACADAGITFIGPPARAIAAMGDKISAKTAVEAADVPVVPGVHRAGMGDEALRAEADRLGYPLLVKPAAGGGGTGMRVVPSASGLQEAVAAARRAARRAFGDDALLLERLLERPRHVEIQILADHNGAVWALTERECSLQRRYQKVVEESPSPVLHADTRERMAAAAIAVARSCGYRGAGTVEFLVPGATAAQPDATFYFLEMNTRLQVEHPVTEAIHRLDLVEWQIRIAGGEQLPAGAPEPTGHAIEARVYAEDPARGFLPTPGTVHVYAEPAQDGVRVDSGVRCGSVVSSDFDPLVAKVIGHAGDRAMALHRVRSGLRHLVTLGVRTNNAFLQVLLDHPDVRAGTVDTAFIEREMHGLLAAAEDPDLRAAVPVVAAMVLISTGARRHPRGWRLTEPAPTIVHQTVDETRHRVEVRGDPDAATVSVEGAGKVTASARWRSPGRLAVAIDGIEAEWDVARAGSAWVLGRDGRMWVVEETAGVEADSDPVAATGALTVTAPMPGLVTVVDVGAGDRVGVGQRLLVIEAMKMEHPVTAGARGVVRRIEVAAGTGVAMGQPLALIADDDGTDVDAPDAGAPRP